MEQQQNNNKMSKVLNVLLFVVQLLPMLIKFLGSLSGKPSTPPADPTPPADDPDGSDFTPPN
jgi:hypothetical protein